MQVPRAQADNLLWVPTEIDENSKKTGAPAPKPAPAPVPVPAPAPPSPPRSGKEGDIRYALKLCDFGLSRKVPDVRFFKHTGDVHRVPFEGMEGTMAYIAPEMFQQQSYTKAVDVWSVGIMLYEMLVGYTPFYPPVCASD